MKFKQEELIKSVKKYYFSNYRESTEKKKKFIPFKICGKTMEQLLDEHIKKHPDFLSTKNIKIIE